MAYSLHGATYDQTPTMVPLPSPAQRVVDYTAPMETPGGVLLNRHWLLRQDPFPHLVANSVFQPRFAAALERAFNAILVRGLSDKPRADRFSKNMQYSDAYGWNFPPDIDGPLAFFYSCEWHGMLARLTGIEASGDVNAALHHHHVGSAHGTIHRDLNIGYFSDQHRTDGINPMDLQRCSYTHGPTPGTDVHARKTVRAATMIYYLANPPWKLGDGGETGLYATPDGSVTLPAAVAPPVNNSILVFENGPRSYHSFICNRNNVRNSVILWLHRSLPATLERWGAQEIAHF